MPRTYVLLLSVGVAASVASVVGQQAKPHASRTRDGRDLAGTWNFSSGVPLQRPAAFADRKSFTRKEFEDRHAALWNALAATGKFAPVENVGFDWIDRTLYVEDLRTSLITYPENGRLPALVEGVTRVPGVDDILALLTDAKGGLPPELFSILAAFAGATKDSYTDFNAAERCLDTSSPPLIPQIGDNYVQIIQGADHVALVSDFSRRIVSLTGRPPAANAIRTWSGIARGRWDGDTLVVESSNFNDRTPSFAGAGTAREKVVTERFTRTAADTLVYSATVVDPKTFVDRIELSFPMARVDARIYASTCHEGNYSLANTLSAFRSAESKVGQSR